MLKPKGSQQNAVGTFSCGKFSQRVGVRARFLQFFGYEVSTGAADDFFKQSGVRLKLTSENRIGHIVVGVKSEDAKAWFGRQTGFRVKFVDDDGKDEEEVVPQGPKKQFTFSPEAQAEMINYVIEKLRVSKRSAKVDTFWTEFAMKVENEARRQWNNNTPQHTAVGRISLIRFSRNSVQCM